MMTAMDDASSQDVLTLQLDAPMYDGGVEINLKKYFALQERLLQEVVIAQETGEMSDAPLSMSDPKVQAQYVRRLGRVSRLFQSFEPLTRQDFGWTPYPSATNLPRVEDLMRGMEMPPRPVPTVASRLSQHVPSSMVEGDEDQAFEDAPQQQPNPVVRYVAVGPVTLLVSLIGFIISGVALFCGWLTRNEDLSNRGTGLCRLCSQAMAVGLKKLVLLT